MTLRSFAPNVALACAQLRTGVEQVDTDDLNADDWKHATRFLAMLEVVEDARLAQEDAEYAEPVKGAPVDLDGDIIDQVEGETAKIGALLQDMLAQATADRPYTEAEARDLLVVAWNEGYSAGRNDIIGGDDDEETSNPYRAGDVPPVLVDQLRTTQNQLRAAEGREAEEHRIRVRTENALRILERNLAGGGQANAEAVEKLTAENSELRRKLAKVEKALGWHS